MMATTIKDFHDKLEKRAQEKTQIAIKQFREEVAFAVTHLCEACGLAVDRRWLCNGEVIPATAFSRVLLDVILSCDAKQVQEWPPELWGGMQSKVEEEVLSQMDAVARMLRTKGLDKNGPQPAKQE